MTEPRATYRLQLGPHLDFDGAARLVPYLADLGVSHLYLSPSTVAARGSTHGYDVADPTRLSDELGGAPGFRRLAGAARDAGMGILLDVVPNHMSTDAARDPWWRDVLEDGRLSPWAATFDIDWEPDDPELCGRVLVPVLGGPLDECLGDLRLERTDGRIAVRHVAHLLPVGLESLVSLLAGARAPVAAAVVTAVGSLPGASAQDPASCRRRERARRDAWARIGAVTADPASAAALDGILAAASADPATLRRLLDAQSWLPVDWRAAGGRLNYRRFFTIASLVGVRVEDPDVFVAAHALAVDLVSRGDVDGLRIDHVDGLRDPRGYLASLADATGGAWTVVEKILGEGEALPGEWRCDGTTGYEFVSLLTGLSVDPAGAGAMRALRDRLESTPPFAAVVATAKREIVRGDLAPDVARTCRSLRSALPEHDPDDVRRAVEELLVGMPVYRTYVAADGSASDADRTAIARAAAAARAVAGVDAASVDALAVLLAGEGWRGRTEVARGVARFQQLGPAVMAKGLEDTALYRDGAVLALCDVGVSPERRLVGPDAFHAYAVGVAAHAPRTLLATSTHDTKRSEDVRARLAALTGSAAGWIATVSRWRARDAPVRSPLLDPGTELALYQTVVAAWPIDTERLAEYAVKAAREAAVHTCWSDPAGAYEEALRSLAAHLVEDQEAGAAVAEVLGGLGVQRRGEEISLAWTLLRVTAPGVPDTYQGCEVWDLSLVDPDNRRPVDFASRARAVGAAGTASWPELAARSGEGLPKLAVVVRALRLRARRPLTFVAGYSPLVVEGPHAGEVVAFARGERPGALTIAPMRGTPRAGWAGTTVILPAGRWRDLLGGLGEVRGGRLGLDRLLAAAPVGLLEAQP